MPPSSRSYFTSVTPASRLSALISHSHHKMLVVAPCAQATRVEQRGRHAGNHKGSPSRENRLAFCYERVLRERTLRPHSHPFLNSLSFTSLVS
jgi:hypothetical protein